MFAGLVLQAANWSDAFGYLLVASLLGDAFLCVLRRLLAGQPIFKATVYTSSSAFTKPAGHMLGYLLFILCRHSFCTSHAGRRLVVVFTLAFLLFLFGFWLDQSVAVPFVWASKS